MVGQVVGQTEGKKINWLQGYAEELERQGKQLFLV